MGEASLDLSAGMLWIHSHIITYGHAANEEITENIREEIETMWNQPAATVMIQKVPCRVQFHISAAYTPGITALDIYRDTDPRNNFFRIEEFAQGNISFVDAIGCNSGYFLLENLYKGSTTAAHEYGHTLGLSHPVRLDIRGWGVPGIMYPRGTITDPQFQYDPSIAPGKKGGTLHPMYRRVLPSDILNLNLHKLSFTQGKAVLGSFTNIYHDKHDK